jgi:hypothetical protein
MAGKTQSHEVSVINVLRSTTLTGFAAHVGLFTAAPTDTTAGTEVSGGGYARQLAGLSAPSGSPSQSANASDILFPVTAAGYTVVAIGLFTASTAGTLVAWAATGSVVIAAGGQAKIAAGALTVQED